MQQTDTTVRRCAEMSVEELDASVAEVGWFDVELLIPDLPHG
jgi:hypothetical protein